MKINLKNIPKNSSSDKTDLSILLKELDRLIPLFTASDFFEELNNTSIEDEYTIKLKSYLTYHVSNRFIFLNQALQKGKRTVDLAIHLSADKKTNYIFCIEAKFLPNSYYVTGQDTAAIKRFRKCEHGLNKRNGIPLSENGIIAYVKKGKNVIHKTKINTKINELSAAKKADKFGLKWSKSEQLKFTPKSTSKLVSNHNRIDKSKVKLHHFWIKVYGLK